MARLAPLARLLLPPSRLPLPDIPARKFCYAVYRTLIIGAELGAASAVVAKLIGIDRERAYIWMAERRNYGWKGM